MGDMGGRRLRAWSANWKIRAGEDDVADDDDALAASGIRIR